MVFFFIGSKNWCLLYVVETLFQFIGTTFLIGTASNFLLMDFVLPHVGAHRLFDGSYRFCTWAPLKNRVDLVLEDHAPEPMTRDDLGYWSIVKKGIALGAKYKFRIDGTDTFPDPASRAQPDGVHGHSVVTDDAFVWSDDSWKGIPLREMIIYEIHVGTFTKDATFSGVISKLDYLKELGVNAIELMPVAQFPGSRNWGYDGVYPFAVQSSYGGSVGLKSLVNEAHQRGIAVILDVVYNHQGPEGNYFAAYGPYFTEKYRTGWGSAINFDDAWCDGVRNYYQQNALMWLDEFHIDGLRMDAVHAIWDFSASHFIQELTKSVSLLEERTGCTKVLIAELDLNNPRYIRSSFHGGYGMTGQWVDEFHHAVHSLITGETDGYYEDFGSAVHLAKALQHSYVYTGEYSIHRKRKFGIRPEGSEYSQFVVFSQNHDQVGNRKLGERLSSLISFEALKLVATTLILAPQVPMLFMGEEYGEKNPFQYFISHTDSKLVELVREGRKKEFSYFGWEGEVPDPQSEDTYEKCILSWNITDDPQRAALFKLYKYLIQLRKSRPELRRQDQDSVRVFDPGKTKVIAYQRSSALSQVLVVLNYDDATVSFDVSGDVRSMNKIFDSSALDWRGPGELTTTSLPADRKIFLHPHSAVVFEYTT